MKEELSSHKVLSMPMDEGEFVLDTDASDVAVAAVLSQRQD